ncbi:7556_t:CDS:2, partial [Funneliformis geosporum]
MVKDRWIIKLLHLLCIINRLDEIHQKNLIHCDLHHGNILNIKDNILTVSDLGLCKSVEYFQSSKNNEIYGVLPFVELISGVLQFNNEAYDLQLSLNICNGKRLEITKNTPQCYKNLIEKCWNIYPKKRPITLEIKKIIKN